MIRSGDLKKGMIILYQYEPWIVLDFQCVKVGKGAAFLAMTLKELNSGKVRQFRFSMSEFFEEAKVELKRVTYSYQSANLLNFMDMETYTTYMLAAEAVGDDIHYLVEGGAVELYFYEGSALNVKIPEQVELTVIETASGGNESAQMKTAVTDSLLKLQVPQFIEEGDRIIVSTADGTYVSRA